MTHTAMAQRKYPICDDFRAACRITAPIDRGALGMGNLFLGSMPKGMCSNKELSIEQVKICSSGDKDKSLGNNATSYEHNTSSSNTYATWRRFRL